MIYHSKYDNCWECGIKLPPAKKRRQNPTRCKPCSNQKRGWKLRTSDFKASQFCPIEQSKTAFV